jgi:hypothetical protein
VRMRYFLKIKLGTKQEEGNPLQEEHIVEFVVCTTVKSQKNAQNVACIFSYMAGMCCFFFCIIPMLTPQYIILI